MNETSVMNRGPSSKTARPAKVSKANLAGQSQTTPRPPGATPDNPPVRQATPERETATTESTGAGAGAAREVTFQFEDGSAKEVFLAGTFTDWDKKPIRMSRQNGGSWQAKVRLPRGRHLYKFLVDGAWKEDPRAKHTPNNFGTSDCVMEVT